jgi:CPA2 family monovalent cation:H+ antiporter-2
VTHIPLLQEIAIIAAVGVLVTVVLSRFRLPSVAGLLLSGALVGPHATSLVGDAQAIQVIAEVGVVLLLFTIGLEFSLERLQHIFRQVALGGLLQVSATIAAVAAVATGLGSSWPQGLFYGFALALSSTAIVLRSLSERRELDAPHGRFIVGALIFQDLCVVPMVLVVPLLAAGSGHGLAVSILLALVKAAAVVVGVLAISRLIVPRVLTLVEASGSRELFLLAVLSLCIGTAWLTSLVGLSLALGAFLGGMVVAGTEYRHRAMGEVLPLRDVFVSFFFVSLGTFFDPAVAAEYPGKLLGLLAFLMLGKGAIATASALVMRFPARAAWLAGVALAQFGEFGFVIVSLGVSDHLVSSKDVAPLLNAGILSMFLTPLLMTRAPHVTAGERLLAPLAKLLRTRGIEEEAESPATPWNQHVIIIGYGLAGRLVARSLAGLRVEHLVLELNAETVRKARARGEPIYYGDATSKEALGHAHVDRARAVIILINDPQAAFRVIDAVRRVAPGAPIFLRTHYLAEGEGALLAGASDVVAEEVEGGTEILARLLRELEVPRNLIDEQVHHARSATQALARSLTVPRAPYERHAGLTGLKVESVLVVDGSAAAHRSPGELELRKTTGALIVAVRREGELQPEVPAGEPLRPGDVAYLIGEVGAVRKAIDLLGKVRDSAGSS